jgi:hypothetical protein
MDHNSLTDFLQVSEHEAELQPLSRRGTAHCRLFTFADQVTYPARLTIPFGNNVPVVNQPIGTAFSLARKHLNEIWDHVGI